MPDTQSRRSTQEQLWMLPVFALVSPPTVLMLALLVGWPHGAALFEAYLLLGYLSPVLGLVTLAILLARYSLFGEEVEPLRMSRRRVAVLAGLAVIAPVWLIVMYLIAIGFNR